VDEKMKSLDEEEGRSLEKIHSFPPKREITLCKALHY
jgi:hypothetical protein